MSELKKNNQQKTSSSFKESVLEVLKETNNVPQGRGNYTSAVGGKTWSPSTSAPPYKTMSGPIGGISGSQELVDQGMVIPPKMAPNLPFPLGTIDEQLADAYLKMEQVEYNLKSCLKQNPVLQNEKQNILKEQYLKAQEIKKDIAEMSKKIELFQLNLFR